MNIGSNSKGSVNLRENDAMMAALLAPLQEKNPLISKVSGRSQICFSAENEKKIRKKSKQSKVQ